MAVYTLNGSGTQALSDGVSRVRVEILVLPRGASIGHAIPNDYFGVGFLRFGIQGSYLRKLPIDGFDTLQDVPPGATTIGWYLFPAGSIRVTEQFAASSPVGNPLRKALSWNANVAGGAAGLQLWTYTVPANRLFRVGAALCTLPAGLAGFSTVMLVLDGVVILQQYSTTAVPASGQMLAQMPTQPLLGPGETLQSLAWNGSASAASYTSYVIGWEFDQATWVPAA